MMKTKMKMKHYKFLYLKQLTLIHKDEIQCQNELLDLLPAIEEANQISILLDKKVMFKAIAVSGQARYTSFLYG